MLQKLLDFLEDNIDLEHIKKVEDLHHKILNFEDAPRLAVHTNAPWNHNFRGYEMEDIHKDPEEMLYSELLNCINPILLKDDTIPMIRANYGIGILPSLFGAKSTIVNGSMPWVEHKSIEEIEKIIEAGVPSLDEGFGQKLTKTHKVFNDILSQYPKLKEGIKIYQPDLQGPFDAAHLLWGTDIYIDTYERPELIHSLLRLITKTYIKLLKHIIPEVTDGNGYNFQWGTMFKGNLTLRSDSVINVSKDMFYEFSKPYDEMIFEEFGGGSMHFCGRADHIIEPMLDEKGLLAFNHGYMPNVEFGSTYLDKFFTAFKDRKKPLVNYGMTLDEYNELDKNKYNTGLSIAINFKTFNDAKEFIKHNL